MDQLQELPAGTALWLVTGPKSCGKTRLGKQLSHLAKRDKKGILIADEFGRYAPQALRAALKKGLPQDIDIIVLIEEEAPRWLDRKPEQHLEMHADDVRHVETLAATLWERGAQ